MMRINTFSRNLTFSGVKITHFRPIKQDSHTYLFPKAPPRPFSRSQKTIKGQLKEIKEIKERKDIKDIKAINELLFKLFHPFFAPCTTKKKMRAIRRCPAPKKGLLITLQSGYHLAGVVSSCSLCSRRPSTRTIGPRFRNSQGSPWRITTSSVF